MAIFTRTNGDANGVVHVDTGAHGGGIGGIVIDDSGDDVIGIPQGQDEAEKLNGLGQQGRVDQQPR